MQHPRKLQWVAFCVAAALATAATAEDMPRNPSSSDVFKSLDADGDARISKDEAAGSDNLNRNFERLDGNSDGFVSKREFQRNTMPRPKPSR